MEEKKEIGKIMDQIRLAAQKRRESSNNMIYYAKDFQGDKEGNGDRDWETIKLMPGYEEAIDKLKEKIKSNEEDKEQFTFNSVITK